MNRRKFIAATGVALTSVGLAGCGGPAGEVGDDNGTDDTDDEDFDPLDIEGELGDDVSEHTEVVEHNIFQTADDVGVTGGIENVSDQDLEYVEVEVTLNDGDTLVGEFVDTSDEEIDYLAAGNTWRFWTTFEDEELTADTSYTIDVEADLSDDADD